MCAKRSLAFPLTVDPVLIELDILDVGPNPSWQLDARAVETLRQLHENLWRIRGHPPEPSGLGYRGFRYVLDGTRWCAFKGWVTSSDHALIDHGRTIERLLLEHLPEEHSELKPRVAGEFDPAS